MKGLILAALVLLKNFSTPSLATEPHHDNLIWCNSSGTCYSAHLGKRTFQRAQDACAQYGGELSTASSSVEVQAILALLKEVTSVSGITFFWLGLSRKASQCTLEDLPLRGFSWTAVGPQKSPANVTLNSLHWVTEPIKTCTKKRCAGLQVTLGQTVLVPFGLVEQTCATASSGYICKYSYGGTCPAPHFLSGSRYLRNMLPHRLRSLPNAEFSPPGTVLALSCSAGQEMHFTCQHSSEGYHWKGSEQRLCSCPTGLWSPMEGVCVVPGDCLSTQGTFLCLCTWGSRLGVTERACLGAGEDAATMTVKRLDLSTPATSGAAFLDSTSQPGLNSSLELFPGQVGNSSNTTIDKATTPPSYSNYVFILVTVAVVLLVILIMAALQVFEVCSRTCFPSKGSQEKKDSAPAASAEGNLGAPDSRTNSEYSLGPSKAELGEVCLDEPRPEVE